MKQHNRLARLVFRLGAAVCVLIVVASVGSFWRSFSVTVAGRLVTVNYGSVWLYSGAFAGPGAWIGPTNKALFLWTTKTGLAIIGNSRLTVRTYPLWWLLLAALIPTALAWRKLRRPPPGHCHNCGYDLTGNVTGKCSECGTEIEVKR